MTEEGGDYRPQQVSGIVWIACGDKRLLGGENDDEGLFYFPIVTATVEVDSKMAVKDGQLVL